MWFSVCPSSNYFERFKFEVVWSLIVDPFLMGLWLISTLVELVIQSICSVLCCIHSFIFYPSYSHQVNLGPYLVSLSVYKLFLAIILILVSLLLHKVEKSRVKLSLISSFTMLQLFSTFHQLTKTKENPHAVFDVFTWLGGVFNMNWD